MAQVWRNGALKLSGRPSDVGKIPNGDLKIAKVSGEIWLDAAK